MPLLAPLFLKGGLGEFCGVGETPSVLPVNGGKKKSSTLVKSVLPCSRRNAHWFFREGYGRYGVWQADHPDGNLQLSTWQSTSQERTTPFPPHARGVPSPGEMPYQTGEEVVARGWFPTCRGSCFNRVETLPCALVGATDDAPGSIDVGVSWPCGLWSEAHPSTRGLNQRVGFVRVQTR